MKSVGRFGQVAAHARLADVGLGHGFVTEAGPSALAVRKVRLSA